MKHRNKCARCGGLVTPVRRRQSPADAMTKHLHLAHGIDESGRDETAWEDLLDDDPDEDPAPARPAVFRYRLPGGPDYRTVERLPFFVYGTLRPGFGNDRLWQGHAEPEWNGACQVPGFRLVGQGIPYAIPAEGQRIIGCLVVPHPDRYLDVIADLDALEGYPSHYDRVAVWAETPNDRVRAWIYTPSRPAEYEHREQVPDNDFSKAARWTPRKVTS